MQKSPKTHTIQLCQLHLSFRNPRGLPAAIVLPGAAKIGGSESARKRPSQLPNFLSRPKGWNRLRLIFSPSFGEIPGRLGPCPWCQKITKCSACFWTRITFAPFTATKDSTRSPPSVNRTRFNSSMRATTEPLFSFPTFAPQSATIMVSPLPINWRRNFPRPNTTAPLFRKAFRAASRPFPEATT